MTNNIPHKKVRYKGAASQALFDTRSVRSKPAIDRQAVLESWQRTWRCVLNDLTPLQRRALEIELGRADS